LPERLTAEEQEEAARTFYIKSQPLGRVMICHISTFLKRPRAYLGGMVLAWRFGKGHPKAALRQFLYFAEAVVVGDWMSKLGLNHIHSHFSSNVAILIAAVHGISFSATFHGPEEFANPSGFHVTEKIAACRFACGISDFGRSQMMMMSDPAHWSKLHVTRLGVDTRIIRPGVVRDHPVPFCLVCVGRLAPEKAQHLLLDALCKVVNTGRNIRLNIAGDGPNRGELERHASTVGLKEHVVFEGFLNQEELQRLFAIADALVLPSFAEGLPVVLMEAMARAIPCISTWVAGVPELIRDGIDGLTVPPGNVDALAGAILRLVDSPKLRRELAESGRKRATEIVDLETNVNQIARLFQDYVQVASPKY
jgi:glycosyltransferase involved in cell wall biosynthesis